MAFEQRCGKMAHTAYSIRGTCSQGTLLVGLAISIIVLFFYPRLTVYRDLADDFKLNKGGELCFSEGSLWACLSRNITSEVVMADAQYLGGATPKLLARFPPLEGRPDCAVNVLWKPQLKPRGRHREMGFNEVIAFHLDCILGFGKVTPAAAVDIPLHRIERAAGEYTWKHMRRRIDDDWMGILGSVQYMIPNVRRYERDRWMAEALCKFVGVACPGPAAMRELAQREMFQYVLGNWDRKHNQFYLRGKEGRSSLIYLDNNHQRVTSDGPFKPRHCQHKREAVESLRAHATTLSEELKESLQKHERWTPWMKDEARFAKMDRRGFGGVIYSSVRAKRYLQHVRVCEEKYGLPYVYEL